jgi:dTDP-4-amino-4,6-dideoxygalactose transaminase
MISKQLHLDLAIFGGAPAFANPLHVGAPNIGDRRELTKRIEDILDRRWLSNNGIYVQEFERCIAELIGVRHCVAMCNATVALEITIRALDLTGEVIVPSLTFIATAHALQWQQITPVFCDIDPLTCNLDPSRVAELITPRTTGIIGVHLWGRPCPVEELAELAVARHLRLIYDAAHAFGCSHKGTLTGNFGDAEVFSFHATKFCNSFEGGAVVTNDDDLAKRLRLMRNFGFVGYDQVDYIGTNGKMCEIAAAMGLTSLESLDHFVAVNYRNYKRYHRLLAHVPGVRLLEYDEREQCNYQYIVLDIDEESAGLSRDQLIAILWAENVRARRYFYPGCHRMEPYRTLYPDAGAMLPVTEALVERVVILPTGAAVSAGDVAQVCELIAHVIEHAPLVREALRTQAEEGRMIYAA